MTTTSQFRMPPSYASEYDAMLDYMTMLHAKRPRPISGFWPRVGAGWQPGGLMVVARTVAGWGEGFDMEALTDAGLRQSIITSRRADGEPEGSNPTAILTAGATHPAANLSDPFWELVRRIHARFAPQSAGADWTSSIAWTALAKLGFADGGNPTEALWYQQQDRCRNLFRIELETLRPGMVLILADDKSVRDFRLAEDVEWSLLDVQENIQFIGESDHQNWFMIQRWVGQDMNKMVEKVFKLLAGDDDDDD
ncbi:hypothetical protein GC173_05540 [bacterium]|nr:hypothetical protein [bacterium]